MADKKNKTSPSDLDPCSVLAKALKVKNPHFNDALVAAQIDAAEAILECAASLRREGEKGNLEHLEGYVIEAIMFLRDCTPDARALGWTLRVRAAKALNKYGVQLKDAPA